MIRSLKQHEYIACIEYGVSAQNQCDQAVLSQIQVLDFTTVPSAGFRYAYCAETHFLILAEIAECGHHIFILISHSRDPCKGWDKRTLKCNGYQHDTEYYTEDVVFLLPIIRKPSINGVTPGIISF